MKLLYGLLVRLFFAAIWAGTALNPKARLIILGQRTTREKLSHLAEKKAKRYWFHCASLGEFEQGRPLMEAFKQSDPGCQIILTFFSPSGYEIRKNFPMAEAVFYLLPDTSANARFFVEKVRPDAAFFVKYEFWPNHMQALARQGIRLFSVSCRFRPGQRFFQWWGGFFRSSLGHVTFFYHQDQASKSLLDAAGFAGKSMVSGDMRFDRVRDLAQNANEVPEAIKFKGKGRLLVAGSTWPAEESAILLYLNNAGPDHKVILAPHDVSESRMVEIERLFGNTVVRFSRLEGASASRVLLVDSVGLLGRLYGHADFALVGGGFSGRLHNILEPVAYGVPVVFGHKTGRFPEAAALVAAGGGFAESSPEAVAERLLNLSDNAEMRVAAGGAAADFVARNTGATGAIMLHLGTLQKKSS